MSIGLSSSASDTSRAALERASAAAAANEDGNERGMKRLELSVNSMSMSAIDAYTPMYLWLQPLEGLLLLLLSIRKTGVVMMKKEAHPAVQQANWLRK